MLHAISWKEYFTLMGLGLLVYYGWWVIRFYPSIRIGGTGKAGPGRPALPVAARVGKSGEEGKAVPAVVSGEVIGKPGQAGAADSSSSIELPGAESTGAGKQEELPFPEVIPKPVFLAELAGDLRNAVQALVLKASETNMVEGELVFAFHQLLTKEPNNRLKGTHFEKKISEQIVSDLERHGPVRVNAEVVSGWWL